MLGLTHIDRNYFNQQFLKFRTQYYVNETKELLARHKLLTAFIVCLLVPGVKNIQVIGIPFYALIDPYITFKAKFIYLIALLLFLLSLTRAQSSFIKGGTFREYLHTLYIPLRVHKAIDFIILLFSLNIVWLAIFFGGTNILHNTKDSLFLASQYCLYASTVFVLCTLLLNFLYKKIAKGIIVFSALLLIIIISKQGDWLLNFGVGLSISLLCCLILGTVQPCLHEQKYSFKIPHVDVLNGLKSIHSLKSIFIIQLAVLRKNKISFLIRFTLCFAISLLILQVLNSEETVDNRQGLILVLMGLQAYILSTLFTFFEKEKLEHALFHSIFPYQKYTQPIKEIMLIWIGLMSALMPVFLFCIFSLKNYCLLILVIFAINSVVFAINRILYALSLRFCLFSSLLNTVGSCVAQYIFLGAC
ncbi:DUF6136 family protein [Legionella septentrionalis]|uniref:DUF6136 family protein n=1 Tax=Legionella septentrionalis TaxID=2498109 RepID=UPI000F8D9703|nr:DUF6136 family protein [Legionella septentrionalis]RUQ95124.1 hypothetical protein ELY11_09740 [Legionella septentrionalis]RUR13389.1 hypothetical protein ELY10_10470 [Legionella septentrionalis]